MFAEESWAFLLELPRNMCFSFLIRLLAEEKKAFVPAMRYRVEGRDSQAL